MTCRTALGRLLARTKSSPNDCAVAHVPQSRDRNAWEVAALCGLATVLAGVWWWELSGGWGLAPLWRILLALPFFLFFVQLAVISAVVLLRYSKALGVVENLPPQEFNTRVQFIYLTAMALWLLSKPTAAVGIFWLALLVLNLLCGLWEWARSKPKAP